MVQAGKFWQLSQREVKLGDIALTTQALDTICELYFQIPGAHQLQESALRIGRGNYSGSGNCPPISQLYAGGPQAILVTFDADSGDSCVASDRVCKLRNAAS